MAGTSVRRRGTGDPEATFGEADPEATFGEADPEATIGRGPPSLASEIGEQIADLVARKGVEEPLRHEGDLRRR